MAAGYSVTSVNLSNQIGAQGNLVPVVIVAFELDGDAGSGEVSVPATGDWQAAAVAAVEAEAGRMMALLNL